MPVSLIDQNATEARSERTSSEDQSRVGFQSQERSALIATDGCSRGGLDEQVVQFAWASAFNKSSIKTTGPGEPRSGDVAYAELRYKLQLDSLHSRRLAT